MCATHQFAWRCCEGVRHAGHHATAADACRSFVCRGASSFRLFQQPLVPMVCAQDGRWLLQNPLQVGAVPAGWVVWGWALAGRQFTCLCSGLYCHQSAACAAPASDYPALPALLNKL